MASGSRSSFASNLSRGMHAAAQPLAILRARFYPELIQQMKKSELLELATSSTEQIERLCTLFGYLQQLVTAENIAPRLAEMQLQALLQDAVEGVELWFQDSGITLAWEGNVTEPVELDRQRTMQALSAVLMIAHNVSAKGDIVKLMANQTASRTEIVLDTTSSETETLSAEANLGLSVAEALVRSQGGEFSFGRHPYRVTMAFPANA